MSSTPHDVQRALTAGVAYPTGEFRYEVSSDTWWWSDEIFRMHGFEPGEVVPTTAMILAHKHPEDRARVAGALENTRLHGGFFGSVHRILDAEGLERVLAIIGEARVAADGRVTEIAGHFVEVTGPVRAIASDEATRQIQASDQHRAVIDQAMGVLVHHTGRTPEEAFDTLREASMRSNVKLRVLAARVVEAALGGVTGPLDMLASLAEENAAAEHERAEAPVTPDTATDVN
ncbi:PAS and ANTAR domain-containing protein [Xylanimonas sp. McL0601]|uniref:PAS and ANTAR domain-containing protein n=1 Tax=Xylanimonas sp. McL0601 TaxID=3414739 RepID=UPI003CFAB02C